jgi:hypothetical protein
MLDRVQMDVIQFVEVVSFISNALIPVIVPDLSTSDPIDSVYFKAALPMYFLKHRRDSFRILDLKKCMIMVIENDPGVQTDVIGSQNFYQRVKDYSLLLVSINHSCILIGRARHEVDRFVEKEMGRNVSVDLEFHDYPVECEASASLLERE